MALDAHQHADTKTQGDECSAAVTDEGQRHPDNGEDSAHHAHVHERVGEEDQRHGAGQQAREQGRGTSGNKKAAKNQQDIDYQQETGRRPARIPR
jgi:hypothetical protein